jgi:hypothetical protein
MSFYIYDFIGGVGGLYIVRGTIAEEQERMEILIRENGNFHWLGDGSIS